MRPRSSILLALSAPVLFAAACVVAPDSSDPADPAAPAPTSLRDVKIAGDFTFASTRGVTIQVSVDAKSLQGDKPFPIEVWNLKKEMLVQARVPANGAFSTDFPLPLGEHELLIKLGDKEQLVTIGDDNVVHATFH